MTEFKDGLVKDVTIYLSWLDRIRVMWHGELTISTCTKTEHEIGETKHDYTHVLISKVFPRKSEHEVWEHPSPEEEIVRKILDD